VLLLPVVLYANACHPAAVLLSPVVLANNAENPKALLSHPAADSVRQLLGSVEYNASVPEPVLP
jgi:hypothetical protein